MMLFQLNGLRKYFPVFSRTVKHNYTHAVGFVHCADVVIKYSFLHTLEHVCANECTHTHTYTQTLEQRRCIWTSHSSAIIFCLKGCWGTSGLWVGNLIRKCFFQRGEPASQKLLYQRLQIMFMNNFWWYVCKLCRIHIFSGSYSESFCSRLAWPLVKSCIWVEALSICARALNSLFSGLVVRR